MIQNLEYSYSGFFVYRVYFNQPYIIDFGSQILEVTKRYITGYRDVKFVDGTMVVVVQCEQKLLSAKGGYNCMKYPKGFLFGTATAAYQVEGAWNEDGKGESIWDRYTHSLTHSVKNDDTGDVAIDHYHRFREDFDILKSLNTNAYRFSISWARIFPQGRGEINQKGIDFYNNVIDALLERGIEPAVTLFHWDLPAALQTEGGWANRNIVKYFVEYARVCFENFGDRVKWWFTVNEPIVFTKRGYGLGLVPPCGKDTQAGLDAAHNALLAHGEVVKLFRQMGLEGKIGAALDIVYKVPATDKPEDVAAAELANATSQIYFFDAMIKGKYPQIALDFYKTKHAAPTILPGDMETISQKLDYIGINYYLTQAVEYMPGYGAYDYKTVSRGYKRSSLRWESDPQGFYDVLMMVKKETGDLPIVISENGWSVIDVVEADGTVVDSDRLEYLQNHLAIVEKAIEDGVNIQGYYLWSAFDNLEWNDGYDARFGIVYVDYATQKRTVKESGKWYAEYIKEKQTL